MPLAQDLEQVSASVEPEQFQTFQRHMDPGFIRQALEATGTATIRKRRLPAEQVVWLVIGTAMFVLRSMKEVVASLDLALPAGKREVAASAITQARTRVGAEPLKWLFGLTGRVWGGPGGLCLMCVCCLFG